MTRTGTEAGVARGSRRGGRGVRGSGEAGGAVGQVGVSGMTDTEARIEVVTRTFVQTMAVRAGGVARALGVGGLGPGGRGRPWSMLMAGATRMILL